MPIFQMNEYIQLFWRKGSGWYWCENDVFSLKMTSLRRDRYLIWQMVWNWMNWRREIFDEQVKYTSSNESYLYVWISNLPQATGPTVMLHPGLSIEETMPHEPDVTSLCQIIFPKIFQTWSVRKFQNIKSIVQTRPSRRNLKSHLTINIQTKLKTKFHN